MAKDRESIRLLIRYFVPFKKSIIQNASEIFRNLKRSFMNSEIREISRIVSRKIEFFSCFTKSSQSINVVSQMLHEHARRFLKAYKLIPNRFRENSKIRENLNFAESQKICSSVGNSLRQQNRHNDCIAGQLMT